MALRTIARLRNTCRLQLRTLTQTSQHTRKTFACGISSNASADQGSHVEPKSENLVFPSDNSNAHVMEDTAQSERSEDTQFEALIKVGDPYVHIGIGQRVRRQKIERATNTSIFLRREKQGKRSHSIVVKGASKESVVAALAKIRVELQMAEKSPTLNYTHFISLPLASHQALSEKIRSLKESILSEEQKMNDYVSWFSETNEKESSNVATINTVSKVTKIKSSYILDPDLAVLFSDDESSDDENKHPEITSQRISNKLFLREGIAHITVLMLELISDDRVNVAAEVLQGVKSKVLEILDGQKPKVLLKGIECLRGTPAEAQVLAMKVEEADNGNCLQRACQAIKDAYTKAGLVPNADKNHELKLHATLMHTSFQRGLHSKPFDARKILAKYRLQEWGEYSINEVHLSQRFLYDESGYYHCCGSFQLPSVVSQSSVQAG